MADNDRLVLHGSFTSSSSYKPMLFLALAGLPFSFRTVNLKNGVQKQPAHLAINRYGQVPVLQHRGLTLVMSNVILDYLARTTGHFEGATEQERWHAREWLSWEYDAITNVARVRHFARFRPDITAIRSHQLRTFGRVSSDMPPSAMNTRRPKQPRSAMVQRSPTSHCRPARLLSTKSSAASAPGLK